MSRILVVEDEKNLRCLYKLELERDGHEVVLAADGTDALRVLDEAPPDLVIMDIWMPGMDGIEAMGRMLSRIPKLPIILYSACSSYKDSFLTWAADAYLVKSSDLSELRRTIREILPPRPTPAHARWARSPFRRFHRHARPNDS